MKDHETTPPVPGGCAVDVPYDLARMHREPLSINQATRALAKINQPYEAENGITADDMLIELHNEFIGDAHGENALFMQTRVLEALFYRLVDGGLKPGGGFSEYTLNMALRVQRQCQISLSALTLMHTRLKNAEQTKGGKK